MAKNNRKFKMISYPEEREEKVKDANRKLRSDLQKEKNKVKQLKKDLASLQRAFDKSCQYINEKLSNQKVKEVFEIVDDFDYKETEKGRDKINKKKINNFTSEKCPNCGKVKGDGYSILNFNGFRLITCKCGFRERVDESDRNEGS